MTPVRFALGLAAAVLAAGCSADTADLQPLQWQKVPGSGPGGAVLGFGSPGSFDERGNFTISAFKEGDVFSSGEISPLATRLDLGPGSVTPFAGVGLTHVAGDFRITSDNVLLTSRTTNVSFIGGLRLFLRPGIEAVTEVVVFPGRLVHPSFGLAWTFDWSPKR